MQLRTLLLTLGALAIAVYSVNTIIQADSLPCVPSNDPSTCLLNYEIKSGAAIDLADPEVTASAFIYSNTCLQLGHKEVIVPEETPILSWGLSFSKPLVLGSEKRPDIHWWTPWFTYDGDVMLMKTALVRVRPRLPVISVLVSFSASCGSRARFGSGIDI
mgnify:FL=1|tara:strand:- start:396 stop:875 length:480 start_codon:yes stop_codon:yes gene_type:complete